MIILIKSLGVRRDCYVPGVTSSPQQVRGDDDSDVTGRHLVHVRKPRQMTQKLYHITATSPSPSSSSSSSAAAAAASSLFISRNT